MPEEEGGEEEEKEEEEDRNKWEIPPFQVAQSHIYYKRTRNKMVCAVESACVVRHFQIRMESWHMIEWRTAN